MTMANATEIADERDGVWDPQGGGLIESGLTPEQEADLYVAIQFSEDDDSIIEPEVASALPRGEHRVRSDGPAIGPNGVPIQPEAEIPDDSIVDLTVMAPVPTPAPARQIAKVQRTAQVQVVRVTTDLDMTYGQGDNNRWNLQKGKRYRLPTDVANHLHEKGLVATWG